MLTELKFVMGAVGKKDLIPAMTHFKIENGSVRSYNGTMAISCPIALDIACCPKAAPMVKAIGNCQEATVLRLTPGGKLSIRSGSFSAFIETIDGPTPHVDPAGDIVELNGEHLLAALKVLDPFIGSDASRPWAAGVLLDGQSAYATNNVCLVQYWLGTPFPRTINLPRAAVRELLRVGEAPTHAQVEPSSMTFHYTDGRWIRTQLGDTHWPMEMVERNLSAAANPQPIHPEFFKGLSTIRALADGTSRVYLKDGALRTHLDQDHGAVYELGLPGEGLYNMEMLGLLEGVVDSIDLSLYPSPCLFFGDRLRGAIVGMRM